jgi:hypothetical protein
MSFDASMINDVDESTIEPESASGSRYRMIQWGYGSPKLAAKLGGVEGNGGFFLPESNIKDEELKPALLKAGWVADTVTYENGKKNPGYYIDTLTFVLVNYRQRWEYKDDTDKTFYYTYDWKEWNRAKEIHGANPKSRIHGYIIIKGLEAFSPFVITLGGSGAMAFTGTKDVPGVLNTFEATVRAAAKKLTGKLWPNRAFWLTVSTAKDKKGVAQFTKVGKDPKTTYVCLPVPVGLPDPKVFVDQIKEKGIPALLKDIPEFKKTPVYLSFDVDCLDPAFAPGTGTPVVGGLSSFEVQKILRGLPKMNLIGSDVVEIVPSYDPSEITQLLAVDVIFEALALMAREASTD